MGKWSNKEYRRKYHRKYYGKHIGYKQREISKLKLKNLSEVDKSWLACAIDTDGCIFAGENGYSWVVKIEFTAKSYPSLVNHFARLIGYRNKIYQHRYSGQDSIEYRITIGNRVDVLRLLKIIQPYLIAKKKQCDLILKELPNIPHWIEEKGKRDLLFTKLSNEIRELNKGEIKHG